MEVSGQLHASAALPPGKSPRYPLDRRLGGLKRYKKGFNLIRSQNFGSPNIWLKYGSYRARSHLLPWLQRSETRPNTFLCVVTTRSRSFQRTLTTMRHTSHGLFNFLCYAIITAITTEAAKFQTYCEY
jgi:hypothetical protein